MHKEHLADGAAESFPPLTLEETNRIQLELMPGTESEQLHWIEDNSEHFRRIVEEFPQLPKWYRENRAECLAFIRKRLEEMSATRH